MSDIRESLVAHLERSGIGYGLHDGLKSEVLGAWADAILAEFDVTPRGEDQWWESLVEAPCDKGHRVFIDDGDGGVYACPVCRLSDEHVKPSVEAVNFTEVANLAQEMLGKGVWPDTAKAVFEAVLAMLPGRTEAEIKAEALREAASAAVTEGEGIPWNHDHDRATVSAWLEGRADYIEKEAEHG